MVANVAVVMEVVQRADSMRTARSRRKLRFQNSRPRADVGPGIINEEKIVDRRKKATITTITSNARRLDANALDNIPADSPGTGVAKTA